MFKGVNILSVFKLSQTLEKEGTRPFRHIPLATALLENWDNIRRKCLAFSQNKRADIDVFKAKKENILS